MFDVQGGLDLAALAVLGLGPRSRNPGEGTFNRSAPGHILEDGICLSCSDDQPDGPMDEATQVLLAAISELAPALRAAFDPSVHPRNPAGSGGGGRFRSNVDRLKDALKVHAAGGGKGDPFEGFDREQLRRVAKSRGIELKRGEGRDSIAQKLLDDLGGHQGTPAKAEEPAKPAPKKRTPRKKAAAEPPADAAKPKQADIGIANRSAGKDLLGADGSGLARRVVAGRDSQRAADHSLAVIGHEQGFDGKPRVVSKAEMDDLVKAGHTETFRGVKNVFEGPSGAEVHEEMRSGHAYYGNGIYGNGYYWADNRTARDYSDGRAGSVARAVISPDAKIVDFYGPGGKDLGGFDEEHTKFLAATDDPEILEVYGDIGRYAAARGYDVIRINQKNGPPFYNVLNRTALVVEEAA